MFLNFDLIDYLLPCSSVIHSLKHCLSELTKTKTNNYNEIADKTITKINLKLKKHCWSLQSAPRIQADLRLGTHSGTLEAMGCQCSCVQAKHKLKFRHQAM